MARRDLVTTYLRWIGLRSVFHRGYVLTSSLYFVVISHLSAPQLAWMGISISLTLLGFDIPAGVWADTIGRKRPLVIGQLFLATGMTLTGLVTALPLLMLTQVLWGLGWAFLNGVDVAWLNDELNEPHQIARVLTSSARRDLIGGATGMIAFGLLGWATSLGVAIVVSGIGMASLALFVGTRFTERNFAPAYERRWETLSVIFGSGVRLSRRNRDILLMFMATTLFNGAGMVVWLFPKRLIALGFPSDPILWYTAVGIVSSAVGVASLRVVERRIDGEGSAPRLYVVACSAGVLGLVILISAPEALIGAVGVLLVTGVASSVTRPISVVWVNRHTTTDVRATVHSFLSQTESLGEVFGGFLLAILAQVGGLSLTLLGSGVLMAAAGALVATPLRRDERPSSREAPSRRSRGAP